MLRKIIGLLLSVSTFFALLLDNYFIFFQNANNKKISNTTVFNKASTLDSSSASTSSQTNSSHLYQDGSYIGKSSPTSWGMFNSKLKSLIIK